MPRGFTTCIVCNRNKPLGQFKLIDMDGKKVRSSFCDSCIEQMDRTERLSPLSFMDLIAEPEGTKCRKCGESHPAVLRHTADGVICENCRLKDYSQRRIFVETMLTGG